MALQTFNAMEVRATAVSDPATLAPVKLMWSDFLGHVAEIHTNLVKKGGFYCGKPVNPIKYTYHVGISCTT